MKMRSFLAATLLLVASAACRRTEVDSIRLADKLAAHPDDPSKPAAVAGVPDEKFQSGESIEAAAKACIEAIKADPEEPRYEFELGRVLLLAGMADEAREHLEAAAQKGHAAAYFYLGGLELETAKGFFRRASDAKFKPANNLVADLKGIDPFETRAVNWQLWVYLALALTVIALIVYWLLRRKRGSLPAGPVAAPTPTP
jgi:hypothetical protein